MFFPCRYSVEKTSWKMSRWKHWLRWPTVNWMCLLTGVSLSLKLNILFKLRLVYSLQIFSREDFMEDEQMRTLIKVTNSKLNVFTHWSVAKFEDKLMQMRDLYQVRHFTGVIIPPANFVCRGYTVFTLSVRPSVRVSVRPSVTLCFFYNSKSHCWIFIKPC